MHLHDQEFLASDDRHGVLAPANLGSATASLSPAAGDEVYQNGPVPGRCGASQAMR